MAAVVAILLAGQSVAHAQAPRRPTRLDELKQANALQQQQLAVQTALQQTNVLVQNAYQSFRQQNVGLNMFAFQYQQVTLQIALQQTTSLQQVARSNKSLVSLALRQQNTLQNALQQTISVQGAVSAPGTTLTQAQLQVLTQEQANLSGLLNGLSTPQRP